MKGKACGHESREIADILNRSARAVGFHRDNIRENSDCADKRPACAPFIDTFLTQ